MPTLTYYLILPSENCLIPVVTVSDRFCTRTKYTPEEVEELRGGIKIHISQEEAERFEAAYERYEKKLERKRNNDQIALTHKEAVKAALCEYSENAN